MHFWARAVVEDALVRIPDMLQILSKNPKRSSVGTAQDHLSRDCFRVCVHQIMLGQNRIGRVISSALAFPRDVTNVKKVLICILTLSFRPKAPSAPAFEPWKV